MSRLRAEDQGTAVLEFVFLAVLLLVPLVYVLLAAFEVQRAAYALSAAAREAGRGYLTAPSADGAAARATAAVDVALRDHGLAADDVTMTVDCAADPCLTPGATVTVRLATTVPLPFVPALLGRPVAGVAVHADHTEVVDAYRAERP
jgi:Flp pilus assembly protein TadG